MGILHCTALLNVDCALYIEAPKMWNWTISIIVPHFLGEGEVTSPSMIHQVLLYFYVNILFKDITKVAGWRKKMKKGTSCFPLSPWKFFFKEKFVMTLFFLFPTYDISFDFSLSPPFSSPFSLYYFFVLFSFVNIFVYQTLTLFSCI